MDNYLVDSARTVSPAFHSDLIPLDLLVHVLNRRLRTNAHVDGCKKALFYGKDLSPALEQLRMESLEGIAYGGDVDVIHAVLGIDTEAAECVEHLIEALVHGTPIDQAQLKNELGDILWYIALVCRSFGWTFEDLADDNIAKLRRRFPAKFENQLALVRGDDQNSDYFR